MVPFRKTEIPQMKADERRKNIDSAAVVSACNITGSMHMKGLSEESEWYSRTLIWAYKEEYSFQH